MCIICCSAAGVQQPAMKTLRRMFETNPHGAGYMVPRSGGVAIAKGFMTWQDLQSALEKEAFTAADPVVYHFRISTQAGVNPEMTHPFPLTNSIAECKNLRTVCDIGIAHNGVIALTSDPTDKEYSDTAHFVAEFMPAIIRSERDMQDPDALLEISALTRSKWALMDGEGNISTVGGFIEENGLLYSNGSYRQPAYRAFRFGGMLK